MTKMRNDLSKKHLFHKDTYEEELVKVWREGVHNDAELAQTTRAQEYQLVTRQIRTNVTRIPM